MGPAFDLHISTDSLISLLTMKSIDGSRAETHGAGPIYVGPDKAA